MNNQKKIIGDMFVMVNGRRRYYAGIKGVKNFRSARILNLAENAKLTVAIKFSMQKRNDE